MSQAAIDSYHALLTPSVANDAWGQLTTELRKRKCYFW